MVVKLLLRIGLQTQAALPLRRCGAHTHRLDRHAKGVPGDIQTRFAMMQDIL